MFERALKVMEHDETTGGPPDAVAQRIEHILSKSNPPLRHPVGPLMELVAILLKRIIPHRLFEWAIAKNYRVG